MSKKSKTEKNITEQTGSHKMCLGKTLEEGTKKFVKKQPFILKVKI